MKTAPEAFEAHGKFLPEYQFREADWWKPEAETSYHLKPKAKKDSNLEADFKRLSAEWKAIASGPRASVAAIVTHPAYLEIISNGEKMIPYILRDLERGPNHWFIALKILAKQFSPVKPEDAGNIKKMTEAWLKWGRDNGKI